MCCISTCLLLLCFCNDTATTEIYTLSLHDALPISGQGFQLAGAGDEVVVDVGVEGVGDAEAELLGVGQVGVDVAERVDEDRKSTRLNSSHANISYAVFCLKKKKKKTTT